MLIYVGSVVLVVVVDNLTLSLKSHNICNNAVGAQYEPVS